MSKITVAIDIDGTLRNLEGQITKYLEHDHPERLDKFNEVKNAEYYSLDNIFDTKEDVHSWMYDERVFELFGMAQKIHPKIIDDLNIFSVAAEEQGYELWIASVQRGRSIPATLHWLSKWGCRIPRIMFFPSMKDKTDHSFDIYLDDCPDVLEVVSKRTLKRNGVELPTSIKVPYGFTKNIDAPELDIENGKFNDIYELLGVERILHKE